MVGKPPRLTAAQMAEIRDWVALRSQLGTIKTLAARYSVSKSTILHAIADAKGLRRMYKRELA